MATDHSYGFRYEVTPHDRVIVRNVVAETGFFYPAEIDVAVELVDERLAKGPPSGYFFVFGQQGDETIGYTCYGPIACTAASYDLYWIAVRPTSQRGGWGRRLMEETERQIALVGGERLYLDTSNRPQYQPTRTFYERCGFRVEAILKDFYAHGDDKVIYVKEIHTNHSST